MVEYSLESCAGHYAPQLAALVVDYIADFGTSVINLVAMAVSIAYNYNF